MKCPSYFPNFPLIWTGAWLSAPYLVPILILSAYTSIRRSGYEFKPCPMYNLIASTLWSWCWPLLLQSMSRHALGHHADPGLLPAGSTGKTALLHRSSARAEEEEDGSLSHSPQKILGCVWIRCRAPSIPILNNSQTFTAVPCGSAPAPLLPNTWPLHLPHEDPFSSLSLPKHIYSMLCGSWTAETDSFFLPSVKQKWGGGTETLSESSVCECMQLLK